MLRWRKLETPAVALPPNAKLSGWRDPFVYSVARSAAATRGSPASDPARPQQPEQRAYRMLLGSGVKGAGGALLTYSSDGGDSDGESGSSLAGGWRCEGMLCSAAELLQAAAEAGQRSTADGGPAASAAAAADVAAAHELGEVWECPLLAQLPPAGPDHGASPEERRWLLAVSPYPVKPPHSPSNPVLCWVGQLDASRTRQETPFQRVQQTEQKGMDSALF